MTLVDTGAASLESGISAATIRHWIRRGKLIRHGYDHAGRALVDLDGVKRLAIELAHYQIANRAWQRSACGSRTGVSH